ncbi:MAG TPA: DUF11 domain-containing protein, partial [Chloroflexia bacterium]|nr:DUF11 domain-containing protein [Chloroflexia bacterium]
MSLKTKKLVFAVLGFLTQAKKRRRGPNFIAALTLLSMVFAQVLSPLLGDLPTASAAGGAYSLKWYAADPAVNRAPYLPTYTKTQPSQLACPTPSGGVGRAADPLHNAVAYGPTFGSNNLDAVTSLAPKDLALGQIVPFELEINVNGSTSPENGVIKFSTGFNTHTSSGDNFGYDPNPNYMVYCAFVDTADPGTNNTTTNVAPTAKVDSFTSTLANPGGGATEEIQGNFQVSGLKNGDNVIVEIWVVLKSSIPASSSGNVATRLISAQTATGDAINTGNQTVPLLRVKEFFTSNADLSITKSDSPDPVIAGNQLTYTITVKNNSTDTVANGVTVTDTLDPNTTFVSASGATCTNSGQTVTCNIGAMSPGQIVTITLVVNVALSAPTGGTTQTGSCTVGATGVDLCNIASVTAITADSNTSNNSASAPTDVIASPALSLTKSANPPTYSAVGDKITYSYVITNSGNVTLSGPFAVIDDHILSPNVVTCTNPPASLAPGAFINCSATYTITQADLNAGSVTNKAKATATFNSNTVTSNEATATVTANKNASLSLTKSATPTTYDHVGQSISYSYVIKNTGNVSLNGPFTVTDDHIISPNVVTCPSTPASLAPGDTLTCTASYSITQADLDAGSV